MRDFKRIALLVIAIFAVTIVNAQQLYPEIDSLELKPWQLKKMACRAEKAGDMYSAIDYYEKYLEHKPEDLKRKFSLAKQYHKARDYATAKRLYDELYEAEPEKFPLALYYGARMAVMSEQDYEGAQEKFKKFKKKHKPYATTFPIKKILKQEIIGCELAPQLMTDTVQAVITHLDTSINKAHVEFAPLMPDINTLIYASLKSDEVKFYRTDEDSVEVRPTRQFYKAKREFENWVHVSELEGPFNIPEMEVGNGTYSVDGNTFYFNRCAPNEDQHMICKIYWSKKENGSWSEPELIPGDVNNDQYTSTQPTVGINPKNGAEVLYFVSDRPKSKGSLDIWYVAWHEKKQMFRKPKNCGNKINGAGKEITPYYDMDTKTLYFASNSWPGLGGKDIFKTNGQLNKWIKPENMGYPINSSVDDFFYTLSPDKQEGFLVSNRPGGVALKSETCCDDIYHFYYTEYVTIGLEGHIFEMKEMDSLHYLGSMLADSMDLRNATDQSGISPLPSGATIDPMNAPDSDFVLPEDGVDPLDPKANIGKLDGDSDMILPLDSAGTDGPTNLPTGADIGLLGGDSKMMLIDTSKFRALPFAKATLFLVDEESGEMIMIKEDSTDAKGKFFFDLQQGNNYQVTLSKDLYFSKDLSISTKEIIKDDTLEYNSLTMKRIPAEPIIVKNIYYDFDKSNLRDESKLTVDTTIFKILKENPHIVVEISSHTDSKGTDAYNHRLSQKRAESIVNYLIHLGIKPNRLQAKGYGEEHPIAPNENEDGSDNEEGRQKNRRTEFKVVGVVKDVSHIIYED